MDRRVTPPKRVTSPTWGPPPPCKQALKRPGLCNANFHERYTKQQFVELFQDVVTIIEKRFVSLFDIIRKLYK